MPWEVAIKLHPELQKCLAVLAQLGPWGTTPGEAAGMILARAIPDEVQRAANFVANIRALERELETRFPVRRDWRTEKRRPARRDCVRNRPPASTTCTKGNNHATHDSATPTG